MIAVVAIVLASWLILGALNLAGCAWAIGRLKRRWARREHYTVVTLWQPPVPGSLADPLPADVSVEALEQAVFDGLFRDTVRREFPYDADKFAA